MTRFLVGLMLIGFVTAEVEDFNCVRGTGFPKAVCYTSKCAVAVKGHIQNELNAAFKYMYMGAYFAQYTVDRLGISKYLFEAATEERGHAIQMLDYLNTRGIKLDFADSYTYSPDDEVTTFIGGLTYRKALEEAVNMEIEVTDLIYKVVTECTQDYHGADVFTNPILDEQHNGVRKLQGALKAYDDLAVGHTGEAAELAEYIFDRKMLAGEF